MLRLASNSTHQFVRYSSNLSQLRNMTPPIYSKLVHEQNYIKSDLEKTKRELTYTKAELATLTEKFKAVERTVKGMSDTRKRRFEKEHNFKFQGDQPLVPFGI